MKNAIAEYLEPTVEEKANLWENSTFVYDTNVLLNLYRFSKNTRDILLRSMQKRKNRIWIPYHVANEFMKNRYEVILESVKRYEVLKKDADSFVKQCIQQLRKKDTDAEAIELKKQIYDWIAKEKDKDLLISNPLEDVILNQLLELFDTRVGRNYSDEELEEIRIEGKKRYDRGMPPGYKDANKQISFTNDNNMFGDLIIWNQIIEYARDEKKDIIFVVNDQKEDWWNIIRGKTFGPRIELRKEFLEKTSHRFHMYTMEKYLQLCAEKDGEIVEEKVIAEVSKISKEGKRAGKENNKVDIRINVTKELMELYKNELNEFSHKEYNSRKLLELYYMRLLSEMKLKDLKKLMESNNAGEDEGIGNDATEQLSTNSLSDDPDKDIHD